MDDLVSLRGVEVSFRNRAVLRDLDLDLAPGEIVGISGPNGCGKTTLIRLVATLTQPAAGAGSVLGARLGTADVYGVRPRIGLISHAPMLIPELTIAENLAHFCRLAGVDQTRIFKALEVVGLAGSSGVRADTASYGMRRRVEVAHLLLRRPSLLLLDEAVSGLDDTATDLIDALIERTVAGGGGVLIVSHERGFVSRRSSRVHAMSTGKLQPA